MNPERILSVSEVNKRVKLLLEDDDVLRDLQVSGEISNFKHHYSSGHFYFTLKDKGSVLRCVMFRGKNRALDFEPADGMKVVAGGYIGVYDVRGEYQLYVQSMQPEGLGSLYLAFEKLKQKLQEEGLFAAERKRPIAAFPRRIGVVTSETAAALRDILNVLTRRFPNIEVVVSPCLVQGDQAPSSIVRAIEACVAWGNVDTIIVSRGGGSIEELWAFNTEPVARAIAACALPVISGVGHETDFTIADFVADLRAPTPSAAAELAVPEKWKLLDSVAALKQRAAAGIHTYFSRARHRVESCDFIRLYQRITRFADNKRTRISELFERLDRVLHRLVDRETREIEHRRSRLVAVTARYVAAAGKRLELHLGRLTALDPRKVLERGYSICLRLPERTVLSSVSAVSPGDDVEIQIRDGSLESRVTNRQTDHRKGARAT